jgi:3-dehydroquinate synthase
MLRRVDVNLGPRAYPVLVGSGCLSELGTRIRERGLEHDHAMILTDHAVGGLYGEAATEALASAGFQKIVRHTIPVSEEAKNWEEFTHACEAMLTHFPDAGSTPLVILLGGGVVGDLGGFAAAVYRRGVPFVQVPTTLLSAVDSSVGGKVAVNFGGVKNIMGAFSQPRLVLCDLHALHSLPDRELRSGVAEVIKYGAVCNGTLFEDLEAGGLERVLSRDRDALVDVVTRCIQLKAAVVEQDEFDQLGIRNVLNFGHTIGHALELSAAYELTHGEAVSVGMIAASRIALRLGVCPEDVPRRLESLVGRAGLPVSYPGHEGLFEVVLKALQLDKKFRNGKNLFVLPRQIGTWCPRENVDWGLIHEVIRDVIR